MKIFNYRIDNDFAGTPYLVGGAVRDHLMGKRQKDFDYVVVGGSEENMLANGFKQVGADFPVFLHPETREEYALARTERKTGLGYGGFEVVTKDVTLMDDLSRRDFTMNAIAMDEEGTIYDPWNGAADIQNKVVRHVSSAFQDDPLRVLRAARFAARYGFRIADETIFAAKLVKRSDFDALSAERILLELSKAITDDKLRDFIRNLEILNASFLMERVIGPISRMWGLRWDKNDVDATLVVLLIQSMRAGNQNSKIAMVVYHSRIAVSYVQFDMDRSIENLVSLVETIGKKGSVNYRWLKNALRILHLPYTEDHWLDNLFCDYWCINSEDALLDDPTLVGPALGRAIQQLRKNAIARYV